MKYKKEPLAVDMLNYLDNCKKLYDEKSTHVNDGSDKKEYSLDLQYITTFALVGIFQKLDELSAIGRMKP